VLRSETRKTVAAVVVALGLFAIVFVALGRAANFRKLVHAASHANQWWFPLCLAGELLAYVGYVLAYRDVARADGGLCLRLWSIVRVVVIGFGAFFAGASVGGLAVDYWALREAGATQHESTRRVLALNTLEWAALAVAACVCSVLVLLGVGSGAPPALTLAWLAVVPACIAAAVWTSQPSRVERLASVPDPAAAAGKLAHFRHLLRSAFADAIGGVALVRHIIAHAHRYPAAVIGYPVYWFGDVLTLYAALRAFGAHIDPASLVLGYATGYVATGIPLPLGGAGGVDASLALSLTLVGVPLAPAVLGTLVYRGFSFWLPIVPALAFLPTLRDLKADIEHADRVARDRDSERPRVARQV